MGNRPMGLAALALLTFSPAMAQEDLEWILFTDLPFASLSYGIPQSDYALISFRCSPDFEGVAIAFDFEPDSALDGMAIDLELVSAGQSLSLSATGFRVEMDDAFIIEATAPTYETFALLLDIGETLNVHIAGADDAYPMPSAGLANKFMAACGSGPGPGP